MQAARKDDPNINDVLPDPRLNPMINPRLGKNLGRWAKVYYTTPPEQRDQAVLELVRELEGGTVPTAETEPPAPAENALAAQTFPSAPLDNPRGPISAMPEQRFCGHCGWPLKKNATGQPHPADRGSDGILPECLPHQNERRDVRREAGETPALPNPLVASDPQAPTVEETPHNGELRSVESLATETIGKKRRSRVQIAAVLLISAAIGAWGLWRIRFAPAPLSAARVVPIVKQAPSSAAPVVQSRIRPPAPPPPQAAPVPSPKLSKPAAGTPVGCTSEHLANCRTDELYRKSIVLADGIDARFIAYDKRINQLLRAATAHTQKGAKPQADRLRQANYSAQLWERLQLRAYASHEKRDALKLRAELTRRVAAPKSEKNVLHSYDNPQSCLELHYIADDLRKLAAKLPRSTPNALRASTRRVANISP